jgi:hypothetical protein
MQNFLTYTLISGVDARDFAPYGRQIINEGSALMTEEELIERLPETVRELVRASDAKLAEFIAKRRFHIAALDRLGHTEAAEREIRGAYLAAAKAFLANPPEPLLPPPWEAPPVDMPPEEEALRQRRSIRNEVLDFVTKMKRVTMPAIRDGISAPQKAVEQALAVHERNGKLVEKPEGTWQVYEPEKVAIAPAPAPELEPELPPVAAAVPGVSSAAVVEHMVSEIPAPPTTTTLGIPWWTPPAAPPEPATTTNVVPKTVYQTLEFLDRCGDMGASDEQLRLVNVLPHVLAHMKLTGDAELGADGRWRISKLPLKDEAPTAAE